MTEHRKSDTLGETGRRDIKVAMLNGVREHCERLPVELWINSKGRAVIRAYNECGNNVTDVDLLDLLEWAATGQHGRLLNVGGIAALSVAQ